MPFDGSQPEGPIAWRIYGAEALWLSSHRIEPDLPALAAEAIAEGFETPSMVLLAGQQRTTIQADLGDLLVRAVRETGVSRPNDGDLPERVMRYRCWQIVNELIRPVDGARCIERLLYADPPPDGATTFSLSDDPNQGRTDETNATLNTRIREAALAVLSSPPAT